jgi:hypothetical protein
MEYIITCISHRRPENIEMIIKTTGTDNIIFVVNDQIDYESYTAKGVKCIIGGSLTKNRNKALDYCFAKNKLCIQIDDDLKKVCLNDFTGKRTGINLTVIEAIENLLPIFLKTNHLYCGAPPTDNPFFALEPTKENILITAPFTITKPNPIRFDETLMLKEDYDYTLQHINNGTGCLRFAKYLFSFKSSTNIGGAVSYRTKELENKSIQYLINKWGECIRLNPKRENEILLNKDSYNILNTNQTTLF